MIIGDVATFPDVKADKEQLKKISEEWGELYSAWERWETLGTQHAHNRMIEELSDLIMAACNFAHALGVDDMRGAMAECERRNHERGRL